MILRFIIFILLFFVLVRVISRLFLPGPGKKSGNAKFFYQTFRNIRQQQKEQQYEQEQEQNGGEKSSLDDIEEAEYEDVTEESSHSST
jgi:hypothetical protein